MAWNYGYVQAPAHRVYDQGRPAVVLPAGRPHHRPRHVSDDHFRHQYVHPADGLLFPPEAPMMQRSRSTGHRNRVGPRPVITHEEDYEDAHRRGRPSSVTDDYYSPEPSPRLAFREHSRPRPRAATSRDPSPFVSWQQELENETLRRQLDEIQREKDIAKDRVLAEQRVKDAVLKEQLDALRKQQEKEAAEKRITEEKKRLKDQLYLEQIEAEKKKLRDAEERKVFEQQAVENWKKKEKEKAEKEKAEAAKKDDDYKQRLKADLGLSDLQISKIIKKDTENAVDLRRTTFTKISRRHISIETLRTYGLDYKLDEKDPHGFVVVSRWIPEFEQDILWDHTRNVRNARMKREREAMIRAAEARQKATAAAGSAKKRNARSRSPGLFGFLGGRR
ncbi:MAG: hypothetical protein M4579_006675 [Chaenotheca gracillima]|nr:MAG: hypothetical protein M4579_006675 [Chaenotheca gracillima]